MRIALMLVAALLAAGCLDAGDSGGTNSPTISPGGTPPTTEGPGPLAFRTLLHQLNVEIFDGPVEKALSQHEFETAWATYAASVEPEPPMPEVDWANERVVAVATGMFGAGCHDVRVTSVARDGNGATVVAYEAYDGEGPATICTAQVVWPTHIVAFEDTGEPLRFASTTTNVHPDSEREPMSLRTLDIGSFSGIHNDTRALVREPSEWQALWAQHKPGEPAPSVEWGNESVIAVVEHGPTGCFGIHIGNVTYEGGGYVIEVVHEETPDNVACIQALSDAYHFAAIPDRPGPARFVETNETAAQPGGSPPTPAPTQPTSPAGTTPYDFRTLAQGSTSGIHIARREVLRDEASWSTFWRDHGASQMPAPERPRVDFAKENVFIATAGDRPDTCWALDVTRIQERATNVEVTVRTRGPPPDAFCGDAITQPFHYVTYPKTQKPLLVIEEGP